MPDADLDLFRTFLHTLAAAVWVGGQVTMVGLVGPLRRIDAAAPRQAARTVGRLAWPAYAVLVATGIWHLAEVDLGDRSTGYQAILLAKLLVVGASGVGAAVHSLGRTRPALVAGGSLAGLGAVGALFLGVWLSS